MGYPQNNHYTPYRARGAEAEAILFAILIKWHLRGLSCWLLTLLHIAPIQDECSRLCLLSVSYMTISSPCKIDCTFLPEVGFPESWAHISLVLTHIGLLRF